MAVGGVFFSYYKRYIVQTKVQISMRTLVSFMANYIVSHGFISKLFREDQNIIQIIDVFELQRFIVELSL